MEGAVADGYFHSGSVTLPASRPDGPCTLCLRPGAWQLGGNGFPCTVQSMRFAGSEILLSLLAENGVLLQKRLSSPPAFSLGDTVFVSVNPAEVLYFPTEVTP